MIHITQHAVDRWQERIGNVSEAAVRARILESSPAIEAAAAFVASVVRLGCGAKLILEGNRVVTVLSRHAICRSLKQPISEGEPQR